MNENAFDNCPKCNQHLSRGFTARGNSLPFAESKKIEQFFHGEEELSGAEWRTFLPHKAEYYQSFLCRDCQVYIVDYSTAYFKKAARDLHREHVSGGP